MIPGDGIGPEVIAEALQVLDAVLPGVQTTEYDLGARRYHATGEALPDSVLEELRTHDAILLGAIGDPSVPSGVLERGLLLRIRFALDHPDLIVVHGRELRQLDDEQAHTVRALQRRYVDVWVAVLRSLNPDLLLGASDPLPLGSWLFIPRRRTTATGTPAAVAATGTALMASPLYTTEALATYLGITVATLENWASAGYGPTPIQLGGLVRYAAADVEAWLAAQIELSQGLGG